MAWGDCPDLGLFGRRVLRRRYDLGPRHRVEVVAAAQHNVPVKVRQNVRLEEPGEGGRLRVIYEPARKRGQQLAAPPKLRQHHLALLDRERARAVAVVDGHSLGRRRGGQVL